MFERFVKFWNTWWSSWVVRQYNKIFKHPIMDKVQEWRDIIRMNIMAIMSNTLNNLTNVEATFEVVSDSVQVDLLKKRAKNIEDKRYEIFSEMACEGDYYIFPALNRLGELYHTYLTQQQVRIVDMDGDDITEAYGIIDWYVDNKTNQTYYLLRHHVLDVNGTLTISYSVVDSSNNSVNFPEWEQYQDEVIQYVGANHIGFGRYKSPISSRGLSPVYGVPLNFGCAEAEEKIFHDFELIEKEFTNGESKIFADPLILKKTKDKKGDERWDIPEYIFPINHREGSTASIDIFSPALRGSEHYGKLQNDLSFYEKQVGTSKGILTEPEPTSNATATEVRRANADTIALINKFRTAIDAGNEMTLEADAVYYNIARDLWTYVSDWYDPFENPGEQWQRLLEAKNAGAAEDEDLIRFIFPNLSEDERTEKLERIKANKAADTASTIDRMFAGEI